jgi:hypothetical protein
MGGLCYPFGFFNHFLDHLPSLIPFAREIFQEKIKMCNANRCRLGKRGQGPIQSDENTLHSPRDFREQSKNNV